LWVCGGEPQNHILLLSTTISATEVPQVQSLSGYKCAVGFWPGCGASVIMQDQVVCPEDGLNDELDEASEVIDTTLKLYKKWLC